ncbi:related to MRPL32 - mitochondrial ribosomal protein of the large subunit [Ustilago trichophora]|uniref:Large ribosomal subunit protein bL32m n=1 Tax=Ustilago trichophora TaxID=86804 RepID=A0A5C3EFA1_9BASI|nr:related to MRPL32 - mitochondrial ribosomal protein of the large subunit [Ustilago trichophora]
MLPTYTRAAAAQLHLQLSLKLTSSTTLRFRLPAILTTPSTFSTPSSSTSSSITPALALSPSTAAAAAAGASESSTTTCPTLGETLAGWWDGLLKAVPKKKVSHSRKSMRAANKGLKDRVDLVHCSGCGKPKAQHHLCGFCYAELNRARKVSLGSQKLAQSGVQKSLNPQQ